MCVSDRGKTERKEEGKDGSGMMCVYMYKCVNSKETLRKSNDKLCLKDILWFTIISDNILFKMCRSFHIPSIFRNKNS